MFDYRNTYADPDPDIVDFCAENPELAARLIEKLGGNLSDAIEIMLEEG